MDRPADVDAYLANIPEQARTTLEAIRRTTKAFVPDAVELIGYGMPGFKLHGRPLVYYAAAKNHCALYGLNDEIARKAGYDTSRKGTIRFDPVQPFPQALLQDLLTLRLAGIESELAKRPISKERS